MSDTSTTTAPASDSKRQPRRQPKLLDTLDGVDAIPPSSRNGFWVNEAKRIKEQPGKVFVYQDVSPTSASNLRKNYGFDAQTRTVEGVVTLYVRYDAEKVEEIKAQVKQRGAKRQKAVEAKAAAANGKTAKASK